MSYHKPEQEAEILSDDEIQVRRLLTSLKRIDAPKDFDFRLQARLARAKSTAGQRGSVWQPRLILPTAAAALLLAAFVYFGSLRISPIGPTVAEDMKPGKDPVVAAVPVSPAGETPAPAAVIPDSASDDPPVPEIVGPKPGEPTRPAPRSVAAADRRNAPRTAAVESRDSSFVKSSTQPEVLQPNAAGDPPETAPAVDNALPTIREVLSRIGIEANLEESKWKVKLLTKDGAARRSGVLVGDIIEAIDDEIVSPAAAFNKIVTGKKIKILRDGKSLDIKLEDQ